MAKKKTSEAQTPEATAPAQQVPAPAAPATTPRDLFTITSRAKELKHDIPLDQLHAFTFGNPRLMEDRMKQSLRNSLKEFGKIEPIVVRASKVQEGKWEILNGHHRFDELTNLGQKTVDILIVDLPDDKQARALVLALNRISADWDYDSLDKYVGDMLKDGVTREYLMEVSGFPSAELEQLSKAGSDFLDEFLATDAAESVPEGSGGSSRAKAEVSKTQAALDAEHVTFSCVVLKDQNETLHNAIKAYKAKHPGVDTGTALSEIAKLFLEGKVN